MLVINPITFVLVTVCKLESTFTVTNSLNKLACVIVSICIVLLPITMEQSVLKIALVSITFQMHDLLSSTVFSVTKIVARVCFFSCLMLPVTLKLTLDPDPSVLIPIGHSSLTFPLKLRFSPAPSNHFTLKLHCPIALKVWAIKISSVLRSIRPYIGSILLTIELPLTFKARPIVEFLYSVPVPHIVLPLSAIYHIWRRLSRLLSIVSWTNWVGLWHVCHV